MAWVMSWMMAWFNKCFRITSIARGDVLHQACLAAQTPKHTEKIPAHPTVSHLGVMNPTIHGNLVHALL